MAVSAASEDDPSSVGTWRGNGRTNEGCLWAFKRSDAKVVDGREKWRDCGFEACRSRQRAWISLLGSVVIFSRSRNELRVLMPGGGADGLPGDCGLGGGGGEGHGEEDVEDGDTLAEDELELGGCNGAVAPGTAASFRNLSIFSWYASFSSETSFFPSSRALDSSLSLYFAMMRSCVLWVARKRTS